MSVEIGVQFHAMWAEYTIPNQKLVLAKMQAAGVKTLRVDVSWEGLQPTNGTSYDSGEVARLDAMIALLNSYGMSPLITLWLTPAWARGNTGTNKTPPTLPGDYATVAQWAAARYTNTVAGWEIWNEPNLVDFYTGDAVSYANLVKAAYPAFKAGYSSAYVVAGALSYVDDAYLAALYAVSGFAGKFDAFSIHPYMSPSNLPPSTADTPAPGNIWNINHVPYIRNLMVANGDGAKSLWFTEFGWSTHNNPPGTPSWGKGVTYANQAAYFTDTVNMVNANFGYVGKIYWYMDKDWPSESTDQTRDYGMLHDNLSEKVIMDALRTANGV